MQDADRLIDLLSIATRTGMDPSFYRVMARDEDGLPRCGEVAHHLGVRLGFDLHPDSGGSVQPKGGGLSVTPEPTTLPPHIRPVRFSGGRGKLPLFEFRGGLPETLVHRPDPSNPGQHGFVEPSLAMPLAEYQRALCGTRGAWKEV